MRFVLDPIALFLLFVGLLAIVLYKSWLPKGLTPSLFFSRVRDLQFFSPLSYYAFLPSFLHRLAFCCLSIAFIDPHVLFPISSIKQEGSEQEIAKEGVAIYLVLDQSGSMAKSIVLDGKSIPKIELLKKMTREFIDNDSSDLMGLVEFARIPRVLVPLTLDRESLTRELEQLHVVQQPEDDGTAMGYAIYKTARLLAATKHFAQERIPDYPSPYEIKSAIIVVVTDGFQDPSHLDRGNILRTMELDDAAAYAKKEGIRLYVINIDPSLSTPAYAPQRRQLQNTTEMTGGQFYIVNAPQDLRELYNTIAHLEKGSAKLRVTDTGNFERFSLYPFFTLLGWLALFFALISDFFIFKVIP